MFVKSPKRQRLSCRGSPLGTLPWLAPQVLLLVQDNGQDQIYSIQFIYHAPEPVQVSLLLHSDRSTTVTFKVFGLKKSSGKKVLFSLEQKEIMIFYNRQASSGIRAEPKDVITCMREAA